MQIVHFGKYHGWWRRNPGTPDHLEVGRLKRDDDRKHEENGREAKENLGAHGVEI